MKSIFDFLVRNVSLSIKLKTVIEQLDKELNNTPVS